jgi:hypothetical protein
MERWTSSIYSDFLEGERMNCYWFWFKGKITRNRRKETGEIYEQNLSGTLEWNGIRLENGFNHCFDILIEKYTKYMDENKYHQTFEDFQKNIKRISDIVEKSAGDVNKMISLAKTQANRITNEGKAINRAIVAKKMKQEEIFEVFFQRAYELGSVTKQEYREYKLEKLGL